MKKFGAKKITALTAALAVVTVGGVYATWSYADSTSIQQSLNMSVAMTSIVYTAGEGSYTVGDTGIKYLNVDQKNDAHNPTLILSDAAVSAGGLIITFTPNAGATSEVQTYGLKSYFQFTGTIGQFDDGNTGSVNMFTLNSTAITIYPCDGSAGVGDAVWTNNNDGTFSITLSIGTNNVYDISNYITINENYVLDTTTLYTSYETALANCSFLLTVDEYTD